MKYIRTSMTSSRIVFDHLATSKQLNKQTNKAETYHWSWHTVTCFYSVNNLYRRKNTSQKGATPVTTIRSIKRESAFAKEAEGDGEGEGRWWWW